MKESFHVMSLNHITSDG